MSCRGNSMVPEASDRVLCRCLFCHCRLSSHHCREAEMRRTFTGAVVVALGMILTEVPGVSQSQPPTEGPAVGGSPAWFLQGLFPDPTGRTIVDASGNVTVPPRSDGPARGAARGTGPAPSSATVAGETPPCRRSPVCGRRGGFPRGQLQRVQWKQTLAYTFTHPYVLPPGFGGVPAVALDSKGNLWVFQRAEGESRSCSSSIRTTRSS